MVNVNLLYPIGSIYISVNSKNPSEIFGGTWERIKGKMLLGVDEDDQDFSTSGKTGGEKEHKLTIDEIPQHYHQLTDRSLNIRPQSGYGLGTANTNIIATTATNAMGRYIDTKNVGGDNSHNNMPPYFTCYIWYRTA